METGSVVSTPALRETGLIKDNIRTALAAVAGELEALLRIRVGSPEQWRKTFPGLTDSTEELALFETLKQIETAINGFDAAWEEDKTKLFVLLVNTRRHLAVLYDS